MAHGGCSPLHLGGADRCDGTGACACTVVVRVVIVGGLVADAVLVWVGMGVADDVPRRAEAHKAESEVRMGHGGTGWC